LGREFSNDYLIGKKKRGLPRPFSFPWFSKRGLPGEKEKTVIKAPRKGKKERTPKFPSLPPLVNLERRKEGGINQDAVR